MKRSLVTLTALAAALAGCAHSAQTPYLPAGPAAAPAAAAPENLRSHGVRASRIYYAGYDAAVQPFGNGAIGVFNALGNGNVAPIREIHGDKTTLISPQIAIVDSQNRLWTCDFNSNEIVAFASGANGNAVPALNISGSNSPMAACGGMMLAPDGTIYATSYYTGMNSPGLLAVWPASASGNVAPQRVYSGMKTMISFPNEIAIDASGRVYLSAGGDTITVVGPTGGNVAPKRFIQGAATMMDYPTAIAIDPTTQNLVVASEGNDAILTFAASAKGNAAPIATIAGSKTLIDDPYGVAVDGAGYVYVGNCPQSGSSHPGSILVFAPGAHGNVKPVQRIIGPKVDSTCITGMTVK